MKLHWEEFKRGARHIIAIAAFIISTFLFFRIMSDIAADGASQTKFFVGMIYTGWLAVMCKQ